MKLRGKKIRDSKLKSRQSNLHESYIFPLMIALVTLLIFLVFAYIKITGQVISSESPTIFSSKYNLSLPPNKVSVKAVSFASLGESSSASKRVIVILKDPKSIASWKSELSNYTEEDLKEIEYFMKEYSLDNINNEKIKNTFSSSFNGFSANLTNLEISSLSANPFVDQIVPDSIDYPTMQDTVNIIGSKQVNFIQTNGLNLTGKGQSVCIIDTGIYSQHPDLGNCQISGSNITWLLNVSYTSPNYPNNYSNNLDIYSNITIPNADAIQLYFKDLDIEPAINDYYYYDALFIYDKYSNIFDYYTGKNSSFWTPLIYGNSVSLNLYTNNVKTYKGYNVSQIRAYKFSSSCNKIVAGYNSFTNDPYNLTDLEGHGTHVAGSVAANGLIKGVAPEASIVFVKAGDDGFYQSDVAKGIDYCVDRAKEYNISVISLSIGSTTQYPSYCDSLKPAYASAINRAVANGISVVIASGNDENYTAISAPACIQNATSIGSVAKNDSISSFSNRNSLVRLMAPGGEFVWDSNSWSWSDSAQINSTCSIFDSDYKNGYCVKSGTSMATPQVAGAIALISEYLRMINQTLTPKQIEDLLAKSGNPVYDQQSNRNYSRINVYNAIKMLDVFSPNITSVSPLNGSYQTSNPINFIFNIDELVLTNATLFVWNNSFNTSSVILSPNQSNSYPLILSNGNYSWRVSACDWNNNCSFSKNLSFMVNVTGQMCTSFNYSSWTQCNSSGLQTRTITSLYPVGCSGGNPDILTQSCSPPCMESDWSSVNSSCSSSGTLTRTWTKINNCNVSIVGSINHIPSETISCTYVPIICTNFTYSAWGSCNSSNLQSRTIVSSSPTNCQNGSPILIQSCAYTPTCSSSNWNYTLSPMECPVNKQQVKTWTKISNCFGGISHPDIENISCSYFYSGNFSIITNNTHLIDVNYNNYSTNLTQTDFNIKTDKLNNKSYIIISSDSISDNMSKVVYLNVSVNSTGICFKDEEVTDVSQVQSKCTYLVCPGVKGNYNCTRPNQNLVMVFGLRHSGVVEMNGDLCGDGICSDSESCSTCPGDCGSCSSGNTGGSSSGGSGGSSGGAGSLGGGSSSINSTNTSSGLQNQTTGGQAKPFINTSSDNEIYYPINNLDLANNIPSKYYILFGLSMLVLIILGIIIVVLSNPRKKQQANTDFIYKTESSEKKESTKSPSVSSDDLLKGKIKNLLSQGNSFMNSGMNNQARGIYEDIKKIYDQLEEEDHSLFEEIMRLYNRLK